MTNGVSTNGGGRTSGIDILHVVHSLDVGGTENGLVNLVTRLRPEFRHAVVAMTEAGPLGARLPAEIPVIALGKRPGLDAPAGARLTAAIRRLRPRIVHTRNWGAMDAVVAARLARVPIVIHGEHGREASDPAGLNPRRNRLRRLLAPLVHRFVAVSLDLEQWLVQTVGIPARKVVAIHNGVDTERFSDAHRAVGRALLGAADDVLVIGTVGRLDPVKDQLGLLDAFAALDRAERALIVIVGDGPCRSALDERARRGDLAGRARLLGERGDVATLLPGFDVFVLPSLAEGTSNTILEAMASGLPVVATRAGGNPELVIDGLTGTLVEVGDRCALTRALAQYAEDRCRRSVHGTNGRQRALQHFSLASMSHRYAELYRAALAWGG